MDSQILTSAVQDQLASYVSQDSFLNPEDNRDRNRSFALDTGVLLDFEDLNFHTSRENPDDPEERLNEYVLELDLVMTSVDDVDIRPYNTTLKESSDYGAQLADELMDIFGTELETYDDESSMEFVYVGQRTKGHVFSAQLHYEELTGRNVEQVELEISASATVTRNIPADVVAEGEEAILRYVILNWWRDTERSEKARLMGISHIFVPVSRDDRELDALQEHIGENIRVKGTPKDGIGT